MKIFLCCLLFLLLVGCNPGKMRFRKDGGQWRAVEFEVERDHWSPRDIKAMEDYLNRR